MSICNGNDTRELCSMYALRKSGKDKKGIDFDQDFLTLKSKLLRPIDGGVFAADYKKYALIVKWKFDVSTKEKRYDFLYQTKTHLRCWERLGDIVPRLFAAYYLEAKGKMRGVQIMERVPGMTLAKFLKKSRSPRELQEAAEQLKLMFDAMRVQRVWHGDLHSTNIILDASEDRVRKAYLIDFEKVVAGVKVGNANFFSVIDGFIENVDENMNWRQLIPYLRQAGCVLPDDFEDIAFEKYYKHLMQLQDKQVAKLKQEPLKLETIVEAIE